MVFQIFDKNGDGQITTNELGSVMRSLGQFPTTFELNQMILEADVDGNDKQRNNKLFLQLQMMWFCIGDGSVSFEDFIDLSCTSTSEESLNVSMENEAEELREAFKVFDKHNRGYITSSDLRMVLQCLGENLSEEESKFTYVVIIIVFYLKCLDLF